MTDDVAAARLDAQLELSMARIQGVRAQLRLARSELVAVLEVLDEVSATMARIEQARS